MRPTRTRFRAGMSEWNREFPEDYLKWHGDWRTRTRQEHYNCQKEGVLTEMPPYHVSMQAYTLDTSAIAILEMHR
ncbi:hypothetical protein TNCV_175071 [Trichonephila clavipes]|nr:hypothetical protein TNCV_175071 [Trichonephila clavipes]